MTLLCVIYVHLPEIIVNVISFILSTIGHGGRFPSKGFVSRTVSPPGTKCGTLDQGMGVRGRC